MRAGGVGAVRSWWSVGVGLRDAVRGRLWPAMRGSVGPAPGGRLRPAARRELRGGRVGRPRGGPSGRHAVGGLRPAVAGRRQDDGSRGTEMAWWRREAGLGRKARRIRFRVSGGN